MREATEEDGVHTGAKVDAGHDHRGRVDERRHRCRARPWRRAARCAGELAALADDPDEKAAPRAPSTGVAIPPASALLIDHRDVERPRREVQDDDADHETDVARAVVRNALSAASLFGLLLPPMADENERAHADELPGDDQHERVVGDDQQQHRRGEQAEEREEVRVPPSPSTYRRVHVHEQRDDGDDEEHHHGEAVDMGAHAARHARRSWTT